MKDYYRKKNEEYKRRISEKIQTKITEIHRKNNVPKIDSVPEANNSKDEVTNTSCASNKSLSPVSKNKLMQQSPKSQFGEIAQNE